MFPDTLSTALPFVPPDGSEALAAREDAAAAGRVSRPGTPGAAAAMTDATATAPHADPALPSLPPLPPLPAMSRSKSDSVTLPSASSAAALPSPPRALWSQARAGAVTPVRELTRTVARLTVHTGEASIAAGHEEQGPRDGDA